MAPRLGADLERLLGAFRAPVYLVAGNHDYWGADVTTVRRFLTQLPRVEPRLRWLGSHAPILLDAERALVGVPNLGLQRVDQRAALRVELGEVVERVRGPIVEHVRGEGIAAGGLALGARQQNRKVGL